MSYDKQRLAEEIEEQLTDEEIVALQKWLQDFSENSGKKADQLYSYSEFLKQKEQYCLQMAEVFDKLADEVSE